MVLVLGYLISTMLLTLGMLVANLTLNEQRLVRTRTALYQAFTAAEGAVDAALTDLLAGTTTGISSTRIGGGTYSATVTPLQGSTTHYLVQGVGQVDGMTQTVEVVAQRVESAPFPAALFGLDRVTMAGSAWTDSYDSSRGYYASTRRARGNIGTNSTRLDSLLIAGSARVDGDLVVGPGANPRTAIRISGSAQVSGVRRAAEQATTVQVKTPPPDCRQRGHLVLANSSRMTLSPGVYCFDSVHLFGGSVLTATGPVEIYVAGRFHASGSSQVRAASDQPPKMKIYVTGEGDVLLAGGTTIYGAISAPRAPITMAGSAVLYGSLVGRRILLAGSGVFHYDEALGRAGSGDGASQVRLLYWQAPAPTQPSAVSDPDDAEDPRGRGRGRGDDHGRRAHGSPSRIE